MAGQQTDQPKGVVALFIGPDGYVWATGTDFAEGAWSGFTLVEAQAKRATDQMRRDFVVNTCNRAVADAMGLYDIEQIMRRMEGYRVHVVEIGHGEEATAQPA